MTNNSVGRIFSFMAVGVPYRSLKAITVRNNMAWRGSLFVVKVRDSAFAATPPTSKGQEL